MILMPKWLVNYDIYLYGEKRMRALKQATMLNITEGISAIDREEVDVVSPAPASPGQLIM